jgi:pantetheine-phosphate adenylyltransferase
MTRIALYPGSFDPVTRGHEDLIQRSLALADRVIVAVAVNGAKSPLFSVAERTALLRQTLNGEPRVEVRSFEGLLADFARQVGAVMVVRGLRAVSDFEYEFQMALMNRQLNHDLETVFLVPDLNLTFVSSSLVREVARFGGDVTSFVHPADPCATTRGCPRSPASCGSGSRTRWRMTRPPWNWRGIRSGSRPGSWPWATRRPRWRAPRPPPPTSCGRRSGPWARLRASRR